MATSVAIFFRRFRQRFARRLLKLRDAEPGEVVLNQRRVFILPTRAGLVFGVMLVVLFIASVNYNLGLGFILTFLLAGCAVIDMHLTHRNLAQLHLSPGRTAPVFAGEEAQFELHLHNRRAHDRYAILLGFIDTDNAIEHAIDVAAHAASNVTLSASTHERGWMPAPRIRLQTRFPLGLMRAWSYWKPDLRALVYPHPEDDAPPLPLMQGEREDGRGAAGHDDFAGIRPYQAGDSPRLLAWRQIARTESSALIAKQFEGGASSELSLDFARLPRTMDVELRLSRMTRWVLMAEARGLPYAFRLDNLHFPPAVGPAHQAACLQALALHGLHAGDDGAGA
ncbi:hypothetical protein GCM10011430_13620 [Oxalicibacterium solurbis]|uniref:DUF58 domain-containing protein n=1 Tax=Oxalicibacterium solurbis TaxID=69280 RepID=A0A8J3B325_9BURK|nr:hypothetical protein GCM10011430_13620 [Oxalicibacterium solurbis]